MTSWPASLQPDVANGQIEPFFLGAGPARSGQRFCIHHPPVPSQVSGCVLYLHPFAEEMNKSRRMAALQARALALAGYSVLQIDLLGCGDSSGEFGDATWTDWVEDGLLAYQWLSTRYHQPLWIWGLRGGALLATAVAERIPDPVRLLLWQPVLHGRTQLAQFMRLALVASLAEGAGKDHVSRLKAKLHSGSSANVAGYDISPGLADGMEQAILAPNSNCPEVVWLELATRAQPELLPASASRIRDLRAEGLKVNAEAVHGPAFWQTTEIEEAPALIAATLRALDAYRFDR